MRRSIATPILVRRRTSISADASSTIIYCRVRREPPQQRRASARPTRVSGGARAILPVSAAPRCAEVRQEVRQADTRTATCLPVPRAPSSSDAGRPAHCGFVSCPTCIPDSCRRCSCQVPRADLTYLRSPSSSARPEPAMPFPPRKPILFISYSRADEPELPGESEVRWLSFVVGHLRPADKHGAVEIWLDRLMGGGADGGRGDCTMWLPPP